MNSDTLWSIIIAVLFFLDMFLTVMLIYLYAWRGMQELLGPAYRFEDFVHEIERQQAEHPTIMPPF